MTSPAKKAPAKKAPAKKVKVPKVSRRVAFYEVVAENGDRVQQLDYQTEFFDVVAALPADAAEHWAGDSGRRTRARFYGGTGGTAARTPLVIVDEVHRNVAFKYTEKGTYSDHAFPGGPDQEFAEPKFLAFFPGNVLGTFVGGLRINTVEASINSWRFHAGMPGIRLDPILDFERVERLARVQTVTRLSLGMSGTNASEIFGSRDTPLARMFAQQAASGAFVSVTLEVAEGDATATQLRDELAALVGDGDAYDVLSTDPKGSLTASYVESGSARPRSHDWLGQALAITVRVEVPSLDRGPDSHQASEALMAAYEKRAAQLKSALSHMDAK